MDQKSWITKANKMLKEYPGMSKDEVIKTLKEQGFARPTGIEGRDSRSFKKKTRSSSGRARRKAQEKVSTEASVKNTKLQRQLIAEDLGIAEYSGLEKPFFEHTYSQDVSGLLEEGSPGDYVQRLPTQDSAFKTEAERISRQNYKNRFAILTTPEGFRAVPREYFSELADPSTLPGIDLDPNVSIKEQFNKYTSSFNFNKGSVRLNRKQLTALAATGVTTYSALGSVASAAETAGRTQLAQQSGNPLDYVQAGLSGVSLAGDVVGAFPPAGPVGEVVSTVADVANIGIDTARDPEPLINVYNKIKEDPLNELEYAGKQVMGGLKKVAGAIIFGF